MIQLSDAPPHVTTFLLRVLREAGADPILTGDTITLNMPSALIEADIGTREGHGHITEFTIRQYHK